MRIQHADLRTLRNAFLSAFDSYERRDRNQLSSDANNWARTREKYYM